MRTRGISRLAVLLVATLVFTMSLITLAPAQSFSHPGGNDNPQSLPSPSLRAFSLPEGSDSPHYIAPLMGNARQRGPKILSYYQQGFGSDASISAKVGELNISMAKCDQAENSSSGRIVRVDLTRSDLGQAKIVDGILVRAAEFAWQTCPRMYRPITIGRVDYFYNISEIDVFLPDGALALVASLGNFVYGDSILGSGDEYHWNVRNMFEETRQRAAEDAARAQKAQAAAVQAQRIAVANARSAAEWNQFWSNVWLGIKLLFWSAIAAWLFSMREIIARWYYSLTPHPAQSMVEASIHRGVELDGKAFAEIMRPMSGGRIEKEVRAQQALKLAETAHRYAETMRVEADRIKAEAQRDAEFIRAQDELTKATTVHEQAKARLDALRKRTG